jgi:adenylate cyclase
MGHLFYFIIASAAIVVALSVFLMRERMRNRELKRLLDHTNSRLEQLQLHFGRFTPQEVIEHLTEPDGRYAARMRSVTVLFADLKGFTKMCDNRDPAEVLRSNPWQVQDAVMGALAMRKALVEYNEELRSKSLPELSFGIGIHQGEVLAGVMGNFELSKFGVVGDTINVAARVEAMTRVHDVDLLITEEVRNQLDDRFSLKEMPAVPIKGKQEPIVTYLVEGLKSENLG